MESENIKDSSKDEINFFDYLILLLKHKRLIAGITLTFTIAGALISLLMPSLYRAETKILSPQKGMAKMSQLLSQYSGSMSLAGIDINATNDLYIEMLKSRTVLDHIIERFALMERYKREERHNVREKLRKVLKASSNRGSGILTIGVEDRDPERASEMANAFVEELRDLTKTLAISEASQRRLFFEEQLKEMKDNLIRSEETLRAFQEKTGAVRIDEQVRAVIDGIAGLRAKIASKEVELKVLKMYATSENPDTQKLEEEIKGLRTELAKLEAKTSSQNPDSLMPTGRIPAVGTEYIRRLREFKYNEAIYEVMLKQYEAARLDEAGDVQLIQVIEKAVPPEKTIKPKRISMILVFSFIGFSISVISVFIIEFLEKTPEKTIETIKRHLSFKH